MIVDAIIVVITAPIGFVLTLLPTITPPGWLTTVQSCEGTLARCYGGSLGDWAGPFGYWVPVNDGLIVGSALLGLLLISLAVHFIRMIASYLTGGGGAT